MLADAFVTGWHATELAQVEPGHTVAVFGAGAVGLLAALLGPDQGGRRGLRGRPRPGRLDKAGELGATPVDFTGWGPGGADPGAAPAAAGCRSARRRWTACRAAIDAVGFQARDRRDPARENPTQVVRDLARLVNPTGHVGIAGVYTEKDLHPAPEGSADGRLACPGRRSSARASRVGFGRTHDRRYTTRLRDLVLRQPGPARPMVTHHGPLD